MAAYRAPIISEEIKIADKCMSLNEKFQILNSSDSWDYLDGYEPLDIGLIHLDNDTCYKAFLLRFESLRIGMDVPLVEILEQVNIAENTQ